MVQDNPYESPNEGGQDISPKDKTGIGRSVYVHTVALLGALLVFVGGFLATVGIPTMVSQELASSGLWVTILLVLGILVGLVCAFLSYRATLRTHAKPGG